MARGKNELHAGAYEGEFLSHMLEQFLENAVAVLIDDIVAFEDLGGQFNVAKNERSKTLADHGAHGRGHRSQLLGNLSGLHFAEGDDALGKIHCQVADAFEVIGDFQGGDNQAHLVVRE